MELHGVFVIGEGCLLKIDLFDVCELDVAESSWDFDLGVAGHVFRAETDDDLRGDGLVVNALTCDGGLNHRVKFFFSNVDEVSGFDIVCDAIFFVFGDEADFEDDAEVDECVVKVLRSSVMC